VPTVEELYGDFWAQDEELGRELERSLGPRAIDSLYDTFAGLGVGSEHFVLDAGCGRGAHSVRLAGRFGCRVVAIDRVPSLVEEAREAVAREGLGEQVRVLEAPIEALPLEDRSVDFVWCRDMLNHVSLPEALRECARVLKPGGRMLVYQTFATAELEPLEAERIYRALAMPAENMSPAYFEEQAAGAGLAVVTVDAIASEWREHWLENGDRRTIDDLLAVARLRRHEDDFVDRYGRERYEAALWGSAWGAYQLLGKLRPTVYVLERTRDG
jgi:SAM-dependent methyltransferase